MFLYSIVNFGYSDLVILMLVSPWEPLGVLILFLQRPIVCLWYIMPLHFCVMHLMKEYAAVCSVLQGKWRCCSVSLFYTPPANYWAFFPARTGIRSKGMLIRRQRHSKLKQRLHFLLPYPVCSLILGLKEINGCNINWGILYPTPPPSGNSSELLL